MVDNEFATLIGMGLSESYDKPWVGFATTLIQHFSTSDEGASLDWVQVEQTLKEGPQVRTVLFWYGIHAGNYWDLIESYNPGLRESFQVVLEEMDIGG